MRSRKSKFIRPKPVRPLGSPAFAALLGPVIFLGMSGLLSKEAFDLGRLMSPFVALVVAVFTGLANFLGTRRFGRKALPFIVAACGFMAGIATVSLFNRLAPKVFDSLDYWTAGTTYLAGAAGAVVFVLLGMIVWRIRRPRTLLET
jgi:fluoride ion exporter CrcB/FEX